MKQIGLICVAEHVTTAVLLNARTAVTSASRRMPRTSLSAQRRVHLAAWIYVPTWTRPCPLLPRWGSSATRAPRVPPRAGARVGVPPCPVADDRVRVRVDCPRPLADRRQL